MVRSIDGGNAELACCICLRHQRRVGRRNLPFGTDATGEACGARGTQHEAAAVVAVVRLEGETDQHSLFTALFAGELALECAGEFASRQQTALARLEEP